MSAEVVYIVIPVVAVTVALTLCLVCWRVWAFNQRRQRQVAVVNQQRRVRIAATQGSAVARVVRVERCVTDEGAFAQRTSYAIDQAGQPTRQFQRTIVIRPSDNSRPDDPNLPPSYDMAVTGKDKAVTVEGGTGTSLAPPPSDANEPSQPPPTSRLPHSQMGSFRPLNVSSGPPAYSPRSSPAEVDDENVSSSDRARLLG